MIMIGVIVLVGMTAFITPLLAVAGLPFHVIVAFALAFAVVTTGVLLAITMGESA